MKRLFLVIAIGMVAAVSTSAQESVFGKNDNVVNLGVSFGGNLYSGYSGISRIPTISLSFERCIIDNLFNDKSAIGVGGLVSYTTAKYDYAGYDYGWRSTDILLGGRGAFHYAFVNKLDTYAGFMLGYNISSWKWHGLGYTETDSGSGGLYYSFFAGARYYFTPSIAAFAEAGYGYSLLTAGLTFKF